MCLEVSQTACTEAVDILPKQILDDSGGAFPLRCFRTALQPTRPVLCWAAIFGKIAVTFFRMSKGQLGRFESGHHAGMMNSFELGCDTGRSSRVVRVHPVRVASLMF